MLVAPSVIAADGSRDGIPMVLKEALALGVPVVASDAVGNPEVVEDAWGALYPAGDQRALAEALRALLERPDREAIGQGRPGLRRARAGPAAPDGAPARAFRGIRDRNLHLAVPDSYVRSAFRPGA